MQRWDAHVAKWEGWAGEQGMEVEFIWWGSSELIVSHSRRKQHAGRFEFWFGDDRRFSQDWFKKRLEEAVSADRASAIRAGALTLACRSLAGWRCSPGLTRRFTPFARLAKEVRRAFRTLSPYNQEHDRIDGAFGLAALREAEDKIH